MIKNYFWRKFKLKTERNYDHKKEKLINLVRPLSLKAIKKMKMSKLQIFIDDIISNKNVNNLLFRTNAKKELEFFYRQQNAVLKNMNNAKSYETNSKNKKLSEIKEIFLREKNDWMFKTIRKDIQDYRINKEIEDKKYRIKLFRLNKNKYNVNETETKLYFKSINDIRYCGYKRSLEKCFEKCKSDPNFDLPDLSLDFNNVFNRLYHNMIISPIKNKSKLKDNRNKVKKFLTKKLSIIKNVENINPSKGKITIPKQGIITDDDPELASKIKKKFNLKNYFKEYKGKEFLMKNSFSTRNICWKKNSGGPNIKLEPPGKVNLNKFKRNKTLDKEYDFIKDVNDYREENLDSNLHLSVKSNLEKLVKYFLDKNYSPNEQNNLGDTPLHYAIQSRNKKIIQLLMNDGGNLNIKNKKGFTPYDLADRELKGSFKFTN